MSSEINDAPQVERIEFRYRVGLYGGYSCKPSGSHEGIYVRASDYDALQAELEAEKSENRGKHHKPDCNCYFCDTIRDLRSELEAAKARSVEAAAAWLESTNAQNEYIKELRAQVEQLTAERDELQAENERLQEVNNKLWCSSCLNTGWIDSDGNCGNCELGKAKGQREAAKATATELASLAVNNEKLEREFMCLVLTGEPDKATLHELQNGLCKASRIGRELLNLPALRGDKEPPFYEFEKIESSLRAQVEQLTKELKALKLISEQRGQNYAEEKADSELKKEGDDGSNAASKI